MKKILSFMLILILIFSLSANIYAVSNKASSTTIEYLATKGDDETVLVSFYIETDIKILDLWEYSKLKNYDTSKYDLDYEYFTECYNDYKQYEREQTKLKNEFMLDFYYNKLNGTENNLINCYPYLEMIQAYMLVSDIHKLDTLSEVTSYSVSDNSGDGEIESENKTLTDFCKDVYLAKKLGIATDDEIRNEMMMIVYGKIEDLYVFRCHHGGALDAFCEEKFGDYIFVWYETYSHDNQTGLYIANSDGDLWTLAQAYENNIVDLSEVADLAEYSYLIGDADLDKEITIKDATTIQKILADLEYRQDTICCSMIEDINLDGKITIKDATAIQKYIAGLRY